MVFSNTRYFERGHYTALHNFIFYWNVQFGELKAVDFLHDDLYSKIVGELLYLTHLAIVKSLKSNEGLVN